MCGSRKCFHGGGGPDRTARKTVLTTCFLCAFFSPQLILQFIKGDQRIYYRESYTFPRIQTGSTIFQGGGGSNFAQAGSICQIL